MDFSSILSDILKRKSVVIINLNDKEKEDRLASLIERLMLLLARKEKEPSVTPMG